MHLTSQAQDVYRRHNLHQQAVFTKHHMLAVKSQLPPLQVYVAMLTIYPPTLPDM